MVIPLILTTAIRHMYTVKIYLQGMILHFFFAWFIKSTRKSGKQNNNNNEKVTKD